MSLIPFYKPALSSNWVWRELVTRDFASKNEALGVQLTKNWTAELAAKGAMDGASVGDCVAGVVIAAATAASPSAASATSTAALGPAPSSLSADPDAGRERSWKILYFEL